MPSPLDAVLTTCSIESVWFVRTELSDEEDNDDRVRDAVTNAVKLEYGPNYDRVCFESASGTQYCRSKGAAFEGPKETTDQLVARVMTFSIPQNPELLATAIEAIQQYHSYEEPVIYVTEGFATRTNYDKHRTNPNRIWNRKE